MTQYHLIWSVHRCINSRILVEAGLIQNCGGAIIGEKLWLKLRNVLTGAISGLDNLTEQDFLVDRRPEDNIAQFGDGQVVKVHWKVLISKISNFVSHALDILEVFHKSRSNVSFRDFSH